jgi:hypothetical protein
MVLSRRSTKAESDASRRSRSSSATLSNGQRIPEDVLVLDGVFARDGAGAVGFRPARRLTTLDVAEVLAAVEPWIRRLLEGGGHRKDDHRGHAEDGGVDPWTDEAPALAGLAAASVQGGRHPGALRGQTPSPSRTRAQGGGHAATGSLPCPVELTCMRVSSSRRGSASGSSGLPLRLATARHLRAARPDGRRPGARRPEAAVGR